MASAGTHSRFSDDVWDLTALPGTGNWTKKIDFSRLQKHGINHARTPSELKELVYFVLHEERTQLPASNTFLAKYYPFRTLAAMASKQEKSLFDALSDEGLLTKFVETKPSQSLDLFTVVSRFVETVDVQRFSFPLARLHPLVMAASRRLREDEEQTPLIPSRVYSLILTALDAEVRRIEAVLPDLLAYLAASFDATRGLYPEPPQTLVEYAAHLGQSNGSRLSDIAGWISNAYVVCATSICAHTGMRRDEAQQLPLAPLTQFEHGGRVHACVRGFTTKFNDGVPQEVTWVTNAAGVRAAKLAVDLASCIHRLHGADVNNDTTLLLFPRHGYGSYGKYVGNINQDASIPREKLFSRIAPVIEAADIIELERIDFERSWRDDRRFQPGAQWPFALHQLRRSLAIYAQRSGLVSLPSLKAQLHHLTQEMALYYAKGSPFAENVAFDPDHFAHDWNAAKAMSSYLGYALNVLMSDERLFGGAAAWAASPAVRNSPVSVYSREHAVQMFKRGEIAYRETPLGGCTSTSECDSSPLQPLPLACVRDNCKNLIVSPRRLQRAIESQTLLVKRLADTSPNSVEHRMEREGLEILTDAAAKAERLQ